MCPGSEAFGQDMQNLTSEKEEEGFLVRRLSGEPNLNNLPSETSQALFGYKILSCPTRIYVPDSHTQPSLLPLTIPWSSREAVPDLQLDPE